MSRLMESVSALAALLLLSGALLGVQGIRNQGLSRQVIAYENITVSRELIETLGDSDPQEALAVFFEEHSDYEILSNTRYPAQAGPVPLYELVFIRSDEPDRTFRVLYECP